MSNKVKKITEAMCRNNKVLGLVSMLRPIELMKALVRHKDLVPKDAAKIIFNLKKKADEGMASPGIETNKSFPVPSCMKDNGEDEEMEEGSLSALSKDVWGGPRPDDDGSGKFPPDPRPNYDQPGGEFPYEKSFTNYMNNPKRKKGYKNLQMSHKRPEPIDPEDVDSQPHHPGGTRAGNIKHKPPFRTDLKLGQPGGDGAGGAGMYSKSGPHSRSNAMPGQGTSWSTKGEPGWSASPKGKRFDRPPQSIRKKDRTHVEFSQPTQGGQALRPDNAGDNDEETPSFMKDPNVGQTIWTPGRQKSRSAPYRTYRKG